MLAALVLGAIWLLMLPEEINPAHIRVFRMLPVPRESRALELWTLFVGMPLALTVAGSALCHAVLALYGETPPEVQRTLLLVVWVGLLVSIGSLLNSMPVAWTSSTRRSAGMLLAVLVLVAHPVAVDYIAYRCPGWAASFHRGDGDFVFLALLCAVLVCLSFSLRLNLMAKVVPRHVDAEDGKAETPRFGEKRRAFSWWISILDLDSAAAPLIVAVICSCLPLFPPGTKADDAPLLFAIVFMTTNARSSWSSDWPSIIKTLALLSGRKRQVVFGTLLLSGTVATLTLSLPLGVWWVEHAFLGSPSAETLTTFGAFMPLLAGLVFIVKALSICKGETEDKLWLYLLVLFGLLFPACIVLSLLVNADIVYFSNNEVFLILGLITLSFGVWMLFDVLRRVLNDSGYYHGNCTE